MASISFEGVFIAPANDLSDTIYLENALSVDGKKARLGEIRRYAGGRTRYVTTPGDVYSVSVSARYASQTVKEDLEALVGSLVLYRDGRGRKVYGALQEVSASEITGYQLLCDLSFSVVSVTHSEEV